MRTGFIFTVILSFALLPPNGFVARVSGDDELFDDPSAGELFDADQDQDEASDEFFADDSVEDDSDLFDAEQNSPPLPDNPPLDDAPFERNNYPDTQRPDFGEIQAQIEQSPGKFKVQELKTKIHKEEDETKRQALADELTEELQKLFDEDFQKRDDELEKLENRVSKLRASLDKRKAARDRIIKNRIESVILQADGLGLPGENGYSPAEFDFGQSVFDSRSRPNNRFKEIKIVETYPDGSKKVVVRYMEMRTEQRQRQTPYTVMVPQTRTRTVNGQEQSYQVNVPEMRTRVETYSFNVPEPQERELIVERGQSVQAVVNTWAQQKFASSHSANFERFNDADYRPRLPSQPRSSQSATAQTPSRSLTAPRLRNGAAENQWQERPMLRTDEPANRRFAD